MAVIKQTRELDVMLDTADEEDPQIFCAKFSWGFPVAKMLVLMFNLNMN